jgi:transcriptional regulator with XRE-family HTH domain/tetratricopeptide (TPR) repeat protein
MRNQKLRKARDQRRWTIEKAAEKVGVSWLTYSRWEKGTQQPHPTTLDLLCQAFDMSSEDLGYTQSIEPPQQTKTKDELQLPLSQLDQNPLITLTDEQVAVLSFLIGGDNMGHFDASRRAMIEQLLTAMGIAKISPQILANHEPWERLASAATKPTSIDEGTLHHFDELTRVCWHLTNGTELTIIEQVLPTFHTKLVTLAQQHSKHQATAADLAAQGYLLKGLVTLDQLNLPAMEKYSQLAVQFSKLAGNQSLEAAALKQQATMALIAKNPAQALQVYQRALPFVKNISPLLCSRVYQGLASAAARCGQEEKEAERYLGLAYDTFPNDFESDPSFLYADSGLSVLHMYAGLTFLDLDQPENAWNAFVEVDGLQPKIAIGEFTQLEFLNLQTKTAVVMGDQEKSRTYLEASVKLANTLDSRYGRSEAYDNYQQMRLVWRGDQQVKALAELFRQ